MTWELRDVGDIECTLDDSGVYVVIHRVETEGIHKGIGSVRIKIRADLMTTHHEPVVSFIGTANNVRKHLIRFIERYMWESPAGPSPSRISREHASYIGYELARAEADPNFVQD